MSNTEAKAKTSFPGARARFVLAATAICFACTPAPRPSAPPSATIAPETSAEARILVLGDVQLASPFKAAPSLTTWRTARLDTNALAARLGEALEQTKPTHIVQLGDLVDLNEAAVLELRSPDGGAPQRLAQPQNEWAPVLALLPHAPLTYPVVGNHERYGELRVPAQLGPDGDALELGSPKLVKKLGPREVHAQLLTHFPHLAPVQFHGQSGSYFVAFARFCLLSLDGADFEDDATLFDFADGQLAACARMHKPAIVAMHYPLFSGRAAADDDALELHAHRARLLALFAKRAPALVLGAHEHFYLRYLPEGRKRAGYTDVLAPRPVYLTVSDLANPYSRKLERVAPTDDGLRYFRGTHYALVTVQGDTVDVVVRGFDGSTGAWSDVDAFRVPAEP